MAEATPTAPNPPTDKPADKIADPPVDAPKPKPGAKPAEKKDEPEKLSLTADEIQARIDAAIAADRKKADDKAKKEKEDADRKAAEAQGNWEKAAKAADEKRAEAEKAAAEAGLRARRAEVRGRLRDYVSTNHPDFATAADKDADPPTAFMWDSLSPQVTAELDDAAADKLIKATVDRYVKANPRAAKGIAGAPAAPRAGMQSAARSATTLPSARTAAGRTASHAGGADDDDTARRRAHQSIRRGF